MDEINFACEFINIFLFNELKRLNEKCLQMSNEERLKSFLFIEYTFDGCSAIIPRDETNAVKNV